MHELAITQALVASVAEEAASRGAARIGAVGIAIGALSHVDPGAVRFAFDSAALGTCAEGARLEIEEPPGTAWCVDCSQSVTIDRRGDPCPRCGGARLMVTGGEDLRLLWLEVG